MTKSPNEPVNDLDSATMSRTEYDSQLYYEMLPNLSHTI